MEKKYGAFSSSVNPQELSLTVTSVAQALIGLVGVFAVSKGLDVSTATTQAQAILDLAMQGIAGAYTLYHTLQAVYGAARKLIAYMTAKPVVPTPPASA